MITVILAVLIASKIVRDTNRKPVSDGVFVMDGEKYEYIT